MSKRIVIIGCGSAGRRHAKEFKSRGWYVTGIDPDPMSIYDWPGDDWAQDWETHVTHKEFAAAIIATPPDNHIDSTQTAISMHIKNILIEKPLCGFGQLHDAYELSTYAKLMDVNVMLANNYRFHPQIVFLRDQWYKRFIGESVKLISRCERDPKPAWGVILDQMSHAIDGVRFVTGGEIEVGAASGDDLSIEIVGVIKEHERLPVPLSIHESMTSHDGRVSEWWLYQWMSDGTDQYKKFDIDADNSMFDEMTDHFEKMVWGREPPYPNLQDAIKTQVVLEKIKELADESRIHHIGRREVGVGTCRTISASS